MVAIIDGFYVLIKYAGPQDSGLRQTATRAEIQGLGRWH